MSFTWAPRVAMSKEEIDSFLGTLQIPVDSLLTHVQR